MFSIMLTFFFVCCYSVCGGMCVFACAFVCVSVAVRVRNFLLHYFDFTLGYTAKTC